MKHLLFTLFTFFILNTNAQSDSIIVRKEVIKKENKNNSNRLKPTKNDFGITLNISGLINNIGLSTPKDQYGNNLIMMRYYFKEDMAFRIGVGLTTAKKKYSKVDSIANAQVKWDSTYKKIDFYISPGIEKHFFSSPNLDPYLAAVLDIGLLGKTKITTTISAKDTIGTDETNIMFEKDGGFTLGLNLIAGFNYFFNNRLAIGAEYGFGFKTMRDGGDWTRNTKNTPISGSQSVKREVGSNLVSSTGFAVNPVVGIHLSWFFNRKNS